jgi:hypothetical protein
MKFRPVPRGTEAPGHSAVTGRQWISDNKVWVLQLDLVLYGVRCHLLRADTPESFELVYCCGQNALAQIAVPHAVMKALENVPEDLQPWRDVVSRFPDQTVKPIDRDPTCWLKLCELAGIGDFDLTGARKEDGPTLANLLFGTGGG